MLSPPDESSISSPFTDFMKSVFSYNGNVMLAAIVSLLLVILFVLVLHIYAKWFLAHARHRRRSSVSVSHVLRPTRFHHFHTFTFETTLSGSPTKGLDSSAISSIPLFVYKAEEHKHGLECVICLSVFEDDDVGRNLPKCGHAFHVQCIDMWLHSHSNCPICRAPAACEKKAVSQPNEAILQEGSIELSEAFIGDLGLIDEDSPMELVVEIPDSENGNAVTDIHDSLSASSSLSSQSSSLGSSLKRMLSRNRSEHKVHPSSISNDSEA